MAAVIAVRPGTPDHLEACVAVLAACAEHFTPDTHAELRRVYDGCRSWVAVDEASGDVVGCVNLEQRHPSSAEVLFAAVVPAARRHGIGRRLVDALLDGCGLPVVEVKTLDASASYEPYGATRAFWEAMGFVQVDCIDPLPGWQPGNPAAVYVCALRPTR